LAALGLGALFYFAHAVFIPIALALLFALVLSTPLEALHRRGLPRSAAALLILIVILSLLSGALNLLWTPAQQWWAAAPQTLAIIETRVQPMASWMNRLELLTTRATGQFATSPQPAAQTSTRAARAPPAPAPAPLAPVATPSRASVAFAVFDQTRDALISIVTVIILVLFLLAGGPPMLARMAAAVAGNDQSAHTLSVINAVRSEVGRYYATIALINIGLGTATAVVMTLLGMPSPLLWGAVAAVFNFIPYIGSAITLLLLIIVAFVTFDSLGHVGAVAASYLCLTSIEGQIVQPLFVGRRLELNPITVFLALWFGGWFWGIAGIIIAVPTLVALKVTTQHSHRGKALAEFLSPNDRPRLMSAKAAAKLTLKRSRAKPSR
jgi:predicted PurR-regulated permease PerM